MFVRDSPPPLEYRDTYRTPVMNASVTISPLLAADIHVFLAATGRGSAFHRPWGHPPLEHVAAAELVRKRSGPADYGLLNRGTACQILLGCVEITNIVRCSFQSRYLGYYAFKGAEQQRP